MKTCNKCGSDKDLSEFYLSGKYVRGECKHCHNTAGRQWREEHAEEKRASDYAYYWSDPDRAREYSRQWRSNNPEGFRQWALRNPEKIRANNKRWRDSNPEKTRSAVNKWHMENRDYFREYHTRWRHKNPDKAGSYFHKRRAVKMLASGSHTADEWSSIQKSQHGRCAICGVREKLERDHVIPLSRGGSDFAFNIQGLCKSCNCRKKDRIDPGAQFSLFDSLLRSMGPQPT